MLAQSLRSSKERTLFVVAMAFSSLVWLGLVVSLVGLLYAPFVALGIVIAHGLFLAHITGNGLRIGSRQLPELYAKVQVAAEQLGLDAVPEVYVVQGGGILNAFATKLLSRRFVILNAEILDACQDADAARGDVDGAKSTLDFVIGHELGHLALGHLSWSWLLAPAKLVPLLGAAYSRACEYSCDACGAAVAGDLETSSRALAVLAAGGRQAGKVNLDAFVEQRHDTGGFLMAVYELNTTHPFLSKRVASLRQAQTPGTAPALGRNPFAYVLAPFFGVAMGGASSILLVYVCMIGVLAAIAIPNFQKFQERSKAAAMMGEARAQDGLGGLDAAADDDEAAPGDEAAQRAAIEAMTARITAQLEAQAQAEAQEAQQAEPPSFEARAWLLTQTEKQPLAPTRFKSKKLAAAYVDWLYKAGAVKVLVTDIEEDVASTLMVELPSLPKARQKLFTLCTTESKKLGYEPCVDDGSAAMYLSWAE